MAFFEYLLAAILGSAGAGVSAVTSWTTARILSADAITQPSGGAGEGLPRFDGL
ncbi:MAG TPA: hypothetical protein VLZ81_14645 [Blastocatellia bacterium]|nr:hypothetical protein [Blastocatellia bacterium]